MEIANMYGMQLEDTLYMKSMNDIYILMAGDSSAVHQWSSWRKSMKSDAIDSLTADVVKHYL